MRRTFLIWLSAVICATFIMTGILVYGQFSRSARERAAQVMSTRLYDMLELFEHAENSISYLSKANEASAADRARALAEIIKLNPAILQRQEDLQGVCNRLGAEQIAVSNEDGVVEAAVPASFIGASLSAVDGIHLASDEADAAESEIYAPDAPEESTGQGVMKLVDVRRLDKPGIVHLAFRTRYEQASREESSFDSPAMRLTLGEGGRVIVFRRGIRVSHGGVPIPQAELMALPANRMRELSADGKTYYVCAVDGDDFRLVGVLSSQEVYGSSLGAVQSVLFSNLFFFIIMFIVVSYLLHRIVLRGLSKVNEALRDITEGDLEKRVNVGDSPEFTRLSNGINFMVDSLRSVGEERQQSIKRGLELARTLQSTVLPTKFPAFPDINRFDLYAASYQANDVGGDFYDYSMPDEEHLHFLVADVDASGFPAALYMMRAMTIIRAIARSGVAPVHIVTEANRELCEDNQTGIRMALFYGSLNINSGELEYVCAGRLCSLVQRAGGEYAALPGMVDSVLGEKADADFHAQRLTLEPQDRIFLVTEGALNASNTNNTPFNERRLQEVLRAEAPTVADVLQLVRSSLRQFVDGSKITKDIAMLCMEYKGDLGNCSQLSFVAAEKQEAADFIEQHMEEIFAAPLDIDDVQKSVGLVLGHLPPETELRMELVCTEHEAQICLIYDPPALNPLELISDALPVDRTAFEYIENKENRLTLWKTLM